MSPNAQTPTEAVIDSVRIALGAQIVAAIASGFWVGWPNAIALTATAIAIATIAQPLLNADWTQWDDDDEDEDDEPELCGFNLEIPASDVPSPQPPHLEDVVLHDLIAAIRQTYQNLNSPMGDRDQDFHTWLEEFTDWHWDGERRSWVVILPPPILRIKAK